MGGLLFLLFKTKMLVQQNLKIGNNVQSSMPGPHEIVSIPCCPSFIRAEDFFPHLNFNEVIKIVCW